MSDISFFRPTKPDPPSHIESVSQLLPFSPHTLIFFQFPLPCKYWNRIFFLDNRETTNHEEGGGPDQQHHTSQDRTRPTHLTNEAFIALQQSEIVIMNLPRSPTMASPGHEFCGFLQAEEDRPARAERETLIRHLEDRMRSETEAETPTLASGEAGNRLEESTRPEVGVK